MPDTVASDEEVAGTQIAVGAELIAPTQHVPQQAAAGPKGHFVLNRDILVANSSAHLRALVDGGGSMNV